MTFDKYVDDGSAAALQAQLRRISYIFRGHQQDLCVFSDKGSQFSEGTPTTCKIGEMKAAIFNREKESQHKGFSSQQQGRAIRQHRKHGALQPLTKCGLTKDR